MHLAFDCDELARHKGHEVIHDDASHSLIYAPSFLHEWCKCCTVWSQCCITWSGGMQH